MDTVNELRNRVPANLHQKMLEVNEAKRLVRRLSELSQVERLGQAGQVTAAQGDIQDEMNHQLRYASGN